jgi:hypothetical protein
MASEPGAAGCTKPRVVMAAGVVMADMEMDVDAEVWVVAHAWVEEEEVVGGEDGEGIMVYEPCPDYIPIATPSLSQNSSCA